MNVELCELHKGQCEKEKMVNIIEFKKGKIKELNVCKDCLLNYLNTDNISEIKSIENIKYLVFENNCPTCKTSKKELETNKLLCSYCYIHFNIKGNQKLDLLKNKMAAAIKVEDYEAAAIFKKEIDQIKNF